MSKNKEQSLRLRVEFAVEDCERGKLVSIPETGQILLANDSALLVLNALAKGADRPSLVRSFVDRYDVERERARSDVDRCLHDLLNLGMIEDARF